MALGGNVMPQRREFVGLAAAAGLAPLLPRAAFALDYPTKPVHVLITTAPGGSSDITTRLVTTVLSDRLGQPFIIDNRPGAGGNIATELVLRAPVDGYTLLAMTKGNLVVNMLYDNLPFDMARDFEPVAGVGNGPLVMLVNPSVPTKTLPEFIAWAKANPGKINYGSAGNATDPHMAGELFKKLAGVEMTHVPYRGGALALTDLLGGGLQLMFSNLPAADYVASGKLRALAVTTAKRSPQFADLPAVAEVLPGYEIGVWYAFVARKGTPPEIIDKLNKAATDALREKSVVDGLAVLTAAPMPMTPAELAGLFASETEKWGGLIKSAGIKAG